MQITFILLQRNEGGMCFEKNMFPHVRESNYSTLFHTPHIWILKTDVQKWKYDVIPFLNECKPFKYVPIMVKVKWIKLNLNKIKLNDPC